MQGQKEIEDDFEQRWSSLKPNPTTRQATVSHSSFPILEQFDDGREPDEMLTVTETSHGLSFEYVWEAAKHDHYDGHNHSSMDTTLNYHSMFFPVPRQDIQAHFPETAGEAEAERVPGTVPVFDAREATSGNEYYIQLEEQDESDIGVIDSQDAEGATASNKDQFVVLQDIRLDESSTDADFFHQSIDSKDSFLQDSHIWSSSDHESPCHANIFSENDSKLDSHSFSGFMELPEISLQISGSLPSDTNRIVDNKGLATTFLGAEQDMAHLGDIETDNTDLMKLLNTGKLTDNYLFLKENSLMKENPGLPGAMDIRETDLSVNPFDDLHVSTKLNVTDDPSESVVRSTQLRDEFLDLVSPILGDFLSPLKGSETLVPSDIFSTEETCSNQLPDINGSSNEESAPLASSKAWIYSTSESTSEVTIVNPDHSHDFIVESATTDILCTDAKPPSLEESLNVPKGNGQYIVTAESSEQKSQTSSPGDESAVINSGLIEDLNSSDSLSDIVLDGHQNRKIEDVQFPETMDQKESLLGDHLSQDMSSLLISDSCLDQISQDSLLEDSISSTLPIIENSAETPDSLDSLDMHREVGHIESLDTPAVHKLQPPYKTADSGYETENLESPEWNSQLSMKDVPEEKDSSNAEEPAAATLGPPEIVVSEVDSVPDVQENGDGHHQEIVDAPIGGSYRDSAYFSDNEEPDKKSDEINGRTSAVSSPIDNGNSSAAEIPLLTNAKTKSEESETRDQREDFGPAVESSDLTCLPELVFTTEEDSDKEEPVLVDCFERVEKLETLSDLLESQTNSSVTPEAPEETSPTSLKSSADNMVHAKLVRTYAGEGPKKKEPDMEGRYLGKLDGPAVTGGSEDGMEADEEDENSEDSDDDMRAYRLHSSGSESEVDDDHPVPVIVSDNSNACNLKSLLKPKSLQTNRTTAAGHSNEDRRAVSFFDDVTVYLFDQV